MIKNAEALILSSKMEVGEGLPMVLLESQALDTLCISSNVKSGPPEILLNGQAGLLFETSNPEDLANKLTAVCSDQVDVLKLVQYAKEQITRFSSKKSAEDFIKVIHEIRTE